MMIKSKITKKDIDTYKNSILETSVLVSLDDAAAMLAIHPRTLRRRAIEGRITVYNDNNTSKGMRFLASELREYVREMRQTMQENRNR